MLFIISDIYSQILSGCIDFLNSLILSFIKTINGSNFSSTILVNISSRSFSKTVSSTIDTNSEKSGLKKIIGKVRDFFYS